MENTIRREKQIKKCIRPWKFRIIEEMNKDWLDSHDHIDPIGTLLEKEARSPLSLE